MRTFGALARLYCMGYRLAEILLIRSGLWGSPPRRFAGRIDRLIRCLWLGREVPEWAIVHGHKMFFPPGFHKAYLETVSGMYEPETTRLVQNLLRPGMNVVDLGANIGYYTLLFARRVEPVGHVYAFEPESAALTLLHKCIHVNGYHGFVTVVPKAVSNKSGIVRLFLRGGDAALGTSLYAFPPDVPTDIVDVEAVTLDEFFEREGWPRLDLVKIDIEGAEKAALEGMTELSRRNPRLKLIMEFGPESMNAAGTSAEEIFNTLRIVGFSRFAVIDKKLSWLDVPRDIPQLIHRSYLSEANRVNLLCQRDE